ncbi:hypothetical protein N9339_00120 [Candidatus Pelagibacter sp.]|nr:hypothetical protein [Candidatus Pelagibacter sp.]
MDRYTKIILTVIAVGLIGNLFDKNIITDAEASGLGRMQILRLIDYNCHVNGSDIICAQSDLKF